MSSYLISNALASVVVLITTINSSPYIENYVIGVPRVYCEENDLALDIVTAQPFRGNIFVKGRAKEPSCKQSYAKNDTSSYSLSLGKCGMQRLRSVSPRGINYIVTVIVSFHPAGFITKNDRAFHVKCFYMEPDTTVTFSLSVSPLLTTELSDALRMPNCDYTVRRDSINGPQLTFANVGDTVFHVWHCSGPDMGMLVKRCYVTDRSGEEHPVIDVNGCSTDDYLINELIYDKSLMRAHAQSDVFKYADTNQLFFTCQIQLCQKALDNCYGLTPPQCPQSESNRSRRATRSAQLLQRSLELDVRSPEFLIGGVDDTVIRVSDSNVNGDNSNNSDDSGDNESCFSPFLSALSNFVLLMMLTVVLLVSLVLARSKHITKVSNSQV